jgi:hypothetical protein
MSNLVNNYSYALKLTDAELSKEIIENFGIKALITRDKERLYIGVSHHESCFSLMRKLRWDFDYSVHKKGNIYIIDIPHQNAIKPKINF